MHHRIKYHFGDFHLLGKKTFKGTNQTEPQLGASEDNNIQHVKTI